jgi:hypothetical protein
MSLSVRAQSSLTTLTIISVLSVCLRVLFHNVLFLFQHMVAIEC